MKPRFFLAAAVLAACLTGAAAPARAVQVVFDDFDDGVLPGDPGDPWTATLGPGTTSVNVNEIGDNLQVVDLNPGNLAGGATYEISQSFAPLADFDVDFDISWNGQGRSPTSQTLAIVLLDSSGNVVVQAEYQDLLADDLGNRYAEVGGFGSLADAPGSLPRNGAATIDIVRVGDQIDVFWDGALFYSGLNANPITEVQIVFSRPGTGGNFGTERVDFVQVQGTLAVPEPRLTAALAMILGTLLASILARRRS